MSSAKFLQRPELISGPNPFIEALPPYIPFSDLPKLMLSNPLINVDVASIPVDHREPLLALADQHFVPYGPLLEPAMAVQQLIRRPAVLLNPISGSDKRRINQVVHSVGFGAIRALPAIDGSGGAMWGETGSGKTTLVKRALQLFSPEQVIDYGRSDACGWSRLKQVVWLHVPMPSNGSRGAMLKRILLEIDQALETDYFEKHKRVTNIDALLALVCKVLILHRVFFLVLDEKQRENFADSPWMMEFALFYITLMNAGISVFLVGVSQAFGTLRSSAQLVRRLSSGGFHTLEVASSPDVTWWSRDFVPRMRKFSLLDPCALEPNRQTALEFQFSSGSPGLQKLLYIESQRASLRRGGNAAQLLEEDIHTAATSPRFFEARRIAEALSGTLTPASNRFHDLAADRDFSMQVNANGQDPELGSEVTAQNLDISPALRAIGRFKAATTRRANNMAKQLESYATLSPADRASFSSAQDHLGGLDDTMDQLDRDRPTKKPSPRS